MAFAAPIISSYCVASVLWSRLFLKERLSWKHYLCIAVVVAGIVILGILDILNRFGSPERGAGTAQLTQAP